MEALYEQFIREKQYLLSVSPRTVEGYRWAWKAFAPALDGKSAVTKADVMARVAELRSQGLTAVTVNTYLRSVNTFCRWLFTEGHAPALIKIPRLKEDKKVLQNFSEAQIGKLVAFRGATVREQRAHAIACLIRDTGIRIDEALPLGRRATFRISRKRRRLQVARQGARSAHIPRARHPRGALFRLPAVASLKLSPKLCCQSPPRATDETGRSSSAPSVIQFGPSVTASAVASKKFMEPGT